MLAHATLVEIVTRAGLGAITGPEGENTSRKNAMKVLIAATALTGHVNPLLAIARMLTSRGDTIVFATAERFRRKVESAGFRFEPVADDGAAEYRATELPPGPERYRLEFKRRFLDPMPDQAETLRDLIAAESPDAIIAGSMFLGVLPLLLDSRPRPPILTVNNSFLFFDRPDRAPVGFGLPPAEDDAARARYAELGAQVDASFVNLVRGDADAILARLGLPPLPASLTTSIVRLPDAFLQTTIPGFEYDFGALPKTLRFVGLLPNLPVEMALPAWWDELDGERQVVLVTQGTLANADFGELVEPTLAALADREDLLVVATTGGRPVEALQGPLPHNARIASFLPFDTLLPKVDLLVTNGGYGSVSQALAAGVPLVSAGTTEDKPEVGARIGWSGTGINLATASPGVDALQTAITRVLAEPRFRRRARAMAEAFRRLDARTAILAAIDDLAGPRSRSAA